jgi:hypothetical protein
MLIRNLGEALRRPVLSPDGTILAGIAPDNKIHLIDLAEAAKGRKSINAVRLPRATQPFVRTCTILRWSPEVLLNDHALEVLSNTTSECEYGKSWLLLSDGKRVIALSTEVRPRVCSGITHACNSITVGKILTGVPQVRSPKMMPRSNDDNDDEPRSNILADYSLGEHLGELSLVEFVFDHRHALVISAVGASAAILSLSRPQRDDIPYVKFCNASGVAQAPDSRYFALLRRDKGQDKITVFRLGDERQLSYKSFDCHTSDAQRVTWCPTGQSLLAVLESAAYGVKVLFYTAQGQALRNYDIGGSVFRGNPDQGAPWQSEGLGLTLWKWTKATRKTTHLSLQVLADGHSRISVRYQSTNSMETHQRAGLTHPDLVDGSKTLVWNEASTTTPNEPVGFTRQTGTFDLTQIPSTTESNTQTRPTQQAQGHEINQIDIAEINSSHSLLAVRALSSPRALVLWKLQDPSCPLAVINFKRTISQVLFHPCLPNVLAVLTRSKVPRIYVWSDAGSAPVAGVIPVDTATSTSFVGYWLSSCIDDGDTQMHTGAGSPTGQRCPFLLTSNAAFDAGYLSHNQGQVAFKSIIRPPVHTMDEHTMEPEGDESITEVIETPSKPGRHESDADNVIVKEIRFDIPQGANPDWRDDPVHSEAKYGKFIW